MNIRQKTEEFKIKTVKAAEAVRLANPIRIRREKKRNQKLCDIIAVNGGRMPAELMNQTFIAEILTYFPQTINIGEITYK